MNDGFDQAAATSNSASLAAATSEQGGASSINEVASIEVRLPSSVEPSFGWKG